VTVYNYYGTKSGVLLALVADSDRALLETMAQDVAGRHDDLVDLVLAYAGIICDHTLTHLDKAIWRQVIAASVSDSDPRFGKLYRALDDRLTAVLIHEIERLIAMGKVMKDVSAGDLGRVLFNIQNVRFIEFIADESLGKADLLARLARDLRALSGTLPRAV